MEKYVPNRPRPDPLGDLARAARDALTPPPGSPPPAPPRGPGITAWYLLGGIVAGNYDVRVMDYATRFSHRIVVRDVPTLAFPELMVPVRPVIQNLEGEPIEIVFSPVATYGDGIRIPGHTQWTPEAITAIPLVGGGTDVNVISPTRSLPGPWGALLVTGDFGDPLPVINGGGVWPVDVTDEAARLLGIADVSDRAARLLGVIASITAAVDVSDRAARLLGKTREELVAMTWASVKSAAPAANAVQATTGALAAGDYDFDIALAVSDTVAVGKGLVIEHRNAADAATLFNLGAVGATEAIQIRLRRYTIALNERIRVIAGTAAGAAASMYVSAIGRRIT